METILEQRLLASKILRECKKQIDETLNDPTVINLRLRVSMSLEAHANALAPSEGTDEAIKISVPLEAQPLTKLFGKELYANKEKPVNDDLIDPSAKSKQEGNLRFETAQELLTKEIDEKATELYTQFNAIESASILDTYSELEIRAVAKKAGLTVTEEHPKNIDLAFVDKVKEAIDKKAEMEAIGGRAVDRINTDEGQEDENELVDGMEIVDDDEDIIEPNDPNGNGDDDEEDGTQDGTDGTATTTVSNPPASPTPTTIPEVNKTPEAPKKTAPRKR